MDSYKEFSMDWRKSLGADGEAAAAAFLSERGVHILMRNFRCRFGEIDIIAKEGCCYLVVEVKTRKRRRHGFPAESVDFRKQLKICRVYDYFRMRYNLSDDAPMRFDVIEVDSMLQCRWIKNAFEYQMIQ